MRYRWWSILMLVAISLMGCGREPVQQELADFYLESTENQELPVQEENVVRIAVSCSSGINLPDEILCEDGSRIEFVTYPNGILGSDADQLRACQDGSITLFVGDTLTQTSIVPEIALLNIPYLYEDSESWQNALSEELKDWFQPYYNKQGLQLLEWRAWYMRCVTSTYPVEGVEDLEMLNMRIIENPYLAEYWNSMDVETKQISFDNLPYALKQGQINSADAGLRGMHLAGILEQMKYKIETNLGPSISAYVMNLEDYNCLTDAQKRVLEHLSVYSEEEYADIDQYVESAGLTCITPNRELKELLRDHASVIVRRLEKNLGKKVVRDFLDSIGYSKSK